MTVIPGGGSTIVQLSLNSAVTVRGATAPAQLPGWKLICRIDGGGDEVLQAQSLAEIGAVSTGDRVELLFDEQLDPLYAARLIIPANQPNIGGRTGQPVGGFADAEGVASGDQASGWIIIPLPGIGDLPELLWPGVATVSGANAIDVQYTGPGDPFTIIGVPPFTDSLGGAATGAVDGGAGLLQLSFAGGLCAPGSVVEFPPWSEALRGALGEYSVPLAITTV